MSRGGRSEGCRLCLSLKIASLVLICQANHSYPSIHQRSPVYIFSIKILHLNYIYECFVDYDMLSYVLTSTADFFLNRCAVQGPKWSLQKSGLGGGVWAGFGIISGATEKREGKR